MTASEVQTSIEWIRAKLEAEQTPTTQVPVERIFHRVQIFYSEIQEPLRQLRLEAAQDPEVLALCDAVARYLLICGDRYFAGNRNNTTRNDQLLYIAREAVAGMRHELQSTFDETYQRNHWHGW
ncbi:MAG: hypothetical protein U0V64_14600 [Cyclobacteriaceae bacterium]